MMAPLIVDCLRLAEDQLASSEREMGDVRSILRDAVARLMRDRSSATALQFQDISDQLLAHACGRLQSLRVEIVRMHATLALRDEPDGAVEKVRGNLMALAQRQARPVHAADLEPGSIDLF